MSDDCVMLSLKDEFGITDGQQILKLSKDERDVILTDLLRTHAGVIHQQSAISNQQSVINKETDLSPFPCPCVSSVEDFLSTEHTESTEHTV